MRTSWHVQIGGNFIRLGIVLVLVSASSLLAQLKESQREQIGEVFGKPTYRDEIKAKSAFNADVGRAEPISPGRNDVGARNPHTDVLRFLTIPLEKLPKDCRLHEPGRGGAQLGPIGVVVDKKSIKFVASFFGITESRNQGSEPKEQATKKRGTLTGRFILDGEPPKSERLRIPTKRSNLRGNRTFHDPTAVHYNRIGLIDQSLIVGKDRGIKNILVWVHNKDVPVPPRTAAAEKLVLRAKRGLFHPRLLAFQTPQTLVLKNEEKKGDVDDFRDFRWRPIKSTGFHVSTMAGQSREFTVKQPDEMPSPVEGNRYSWIKTYLFPCAHPFFAVTAEDGKFSIGNLPPGEWEFRVWHERCGWGRTDQWPKGRFTLKIEPGERDVGAIKLAPRLFEDK